MYSIDKKTNSEVLKSNPEVEGSQTLTALSILGCCRGIGRGSDSLRCCCESQGWGAGHVLPSLFHGTGGACAGSAPPGAGRCL